jgi:hypothetical protein
LILGQNSLSEAGVEFMSAILTYLH